MKNIDEYMKYYMKNIDVNRFQIYLSWSNKKVSRAAIVMKFCTNFNEFPKHIWS